MTKQVPKSPKLLPVALSFVFLTVALVGFGMYWWQQFAASGKPQRQVVIQEKYRTEYEACGAAYKDQVRKNLELEEELKGLRTHLERIKPTFYNLAENQNAIFESFKHYFAVTLPVGWYFPSEDETNPRFANCRRYEECSLWLSMQDLSQTLPEKSAAQRKAELRAHQNFVTQFDQLIGGASVLKLKEKDDWDTPIFHYYIFPTAQHRVYLATTNHESLEQTILKTFRFLNRCTIHPLIADIGSVYYPVDEEKYGQGILGEIFTADDCGPERFADGFGNRIRPAYVSLSLKGNPSSALEVVLGQIGFESNCQDSNAVQQCTFWVLNSEKGVPYRELLKLKPYTVEIERSKNDYYGG